MLTCRSLVVLPVLGLLAAMTVFAQQPAVAPVPDDPLELAHGPVQVAETPQARAAAVQLLEKAQQNADMFAPGSAAFSLKVSFTADGPVLYTGAGAMEETWLSPATSRWSVRLGDFSLTRTFFRGASFDDRSVNFIPMRVQMLRGALYWPINLETARPLIRTATANWQGKEVTCILVSGPQAEATPTPDRRWYEKEYCVDSVTGLLQVWSEAPGIFVLYDYSEGSVFHGHTLPRQISIVEAGNSVLEAHVDSIAEAAATDPDSLKPTQQTMQNGPLLSGAMRFPQAVRVAPGASTVQPVIVHAILDGDGKVVEAELLDNSGMALSKSALDLVRHSSYVHARNRRRQREAFINVRFISQ